MELRMKEFNNLDILIVILVTVAGVISVVTFELNETVIRSILGLLLVLFLPGYSIIAFLYPEREVIDNIERLALSFGLSIAVTPLIGLILNYTPFGIRLIPLLLSLSLFTVLMISGAYFRRNKIPKTERFCIDIKRHYSNKINLFKKESTGNKILSAVLIILIISTISIAAYIAATPNDGDKYTEFYIMGPNGKASDYPINLTIGQVGTVNIEIINHEYAKINYKLIVKLNNKTLKDENISLTNNGKYEDTFNFTAPAVSNGKLEFLLYKLPDDTNAYRYLQLYINAK